ncbi:MAG: hypothetical protein CG439_200 [Methylococcaceae bacterium NSP1-2]|nr:hypothetical protein [Methylococcaceae bacterium]OYV21087.1 MAG: hypothetical protein CG439_200 [Methylococcaceae bacterium NSP1-2]
MKTLLRIFLLLLCALILLCVMLVVFGISDTPEIELDWSLTRDDIVRAKKILREGSKTKPDEISTIELSHADLNLAANYLLNRYSKSAVQISLKENKLKFVVTTTLPENRLGKYLNVTFRLGNEEGSQLPTITKFKAGKLLIPAKIAGFIINTLIEHSALNNYFMLATRPIQGIKIDPEKITISYSSNLETLITARNVLTHTDNTPALSIYQQKIADIIAHHDPNWRLSLADLLKPLFEIAYQRSNLDNAIEENRLVIISINDYVNKKQNKQFLPASPPAQGKQYAAFLYKRSDLAQHFIGSAALTASVNDQVAKVVGEEKELSDAQGGSGFSFVDLAADKAGTRFGEIATSSPENARKLQLAMTQIKDYTDFMPDPRDLPEKMNEADFKSRYGSINSAAYQELSKKIDARIAAIPLYKMN